MVNTNQPLTNPDLNAAISALQKYLTPETEKAFLELLKDAHFLVPAEGGIEHGGADAGGKATIKKATTIKLPIVEDEQGNRWQIAFTDWTSLKLWRSIKDESALILSFAEISAIILNEKNMATGLLINPDSNNLPITKRMLAQINSQYNTGKEKELSTSKHHTKIAKALKSLLKKMR
jgi:hypothetical protein